MLTKKQKKIIESMINKIEKSLKKEFPNDNWKVYCLNFPKFNEKPDNKAGFTENVNFSLSKN